MTVMAAALHVRCVAYAVCHAACGACGAPTAPAPAPLRASRAVASRPLRDRTAPSLHALHYASGVRYAHLYNPRAPQRPRHAAGDYAPAACHVLCVRRRAPHVLATLEGRPPQTAGFVEAAAKLRPTVAVIGSSKVVGEVTAAARQRQAARRRARLPPQLRRGVTAPTSHNGAHYAFVHPQPRPARTRSASGGSHVGASGRIAALEQKAFCSLGAARPRLRGW
jgi:hypothetical protein